MNLHLQYITIFVIFATIATLCSETTLLQTLRYLNEEAVDISYVKPLKHKHSFVANLPLQINSIELSNNTALLKMRVVYFLNTKVNSRFTEWMHHQFSTLPEVDEIHVVADSLHCHNDTRLQGSVDWLRGYRSGRYSDESLFVDCHDDPVETYEYHGIKKLWDLGQQYSGRNDIAIYFHARGTSRFPSFQKYVRKSLTFPTGHKIWRLTQLVFSRAAMERTKEAFALFPGVDRAGFDCSSVNGFGWVWYNFMYMRGSYLNKVEEPLLTTRRHYYENWSARWGLPAQENGSHSEQRDDKDFEKVMNDDSLCYALSANYFPRHANLGHAFVAHPKMKLSRYKHYTAPTMSSPESPTMSSVE